MVREAILAKAADQVVVPINAVNLSLGPQAKPFVGRLKFSSHLIQLLLDLVIVCNDTINNGFDQVLSAWDITQVGPFHDDFFVSFDMGLRLRVGASHEVIPWHRVLALKCDAQECTLVYKPECMGYTEKVWEHLKVSRNATSLAEERSCYTQDGEPTQCHPNIKQSAETARVAYDEFIAAYGCGQDRRTVRISHDDPNWQNAFDACRAKN
jgi:hypothetical protein